MIDYFLNPDDGEDFLQFIQDVRDDFDDRQDEYLEMVQDIVPEAVSIALIGSYAYGGEPTPDSDVDLEVLYTGLLEPAEVQLMLRGQIYGFGGCFDIIPTRIEHNPNYWDYY